MSDDLVKRLDSLRSMLVDEGFYTKANTVMLAKDRIEELEAKLRESALQELSALGQASEAYQAQLAAEARTVDLEVKLAKAVAAIEEMQTASDAMMLHIARTTLEELKGEK